MKKTLGTILLSASLAITPAYSSETKTQQLTAQQFQSCITKADELTYVMKSIKEKTKQNNEFSEYILSFETSIKGIEKFIEGFENQYTKEFSQELTYKEFELEELKSGTKEYKVTQNRIKELEHNILQYKSSDYFQGLLTTKQTLENLYSNGSKQALANSEEVFQENKKFEISRDSFIEECHTNKSVTPEIEKQVCAKNKHSIVCK